MNEVIALLLDIQRKVNTIIQNQQTLYQGELKMVVDLTALKAQVAQTQQVEASAVTLINGIASQLKALSAQIASGATDRAAAQQAVDALTTQLGNDAQSLAAAVTANTPEPQKIGV